MVLLTVKMNFGDGASDAEGETLERYFDAASSGTVDTVRTLIKGMVDINAKNDRGWTGLMLAARNGHMSVISALLEQGCDKEALNPSGQTALDIATFWNHKGAADILRSQTKEQRLDQNCRNYFSLNLLNRAAEKRKNKAWLEDTMQKTSTRYILFTDLKPLVIEVPKSSRRRGRYRLARFTFEDIRFHLPSNPAVILLGQERSPPTVDIGVSQHPEDDLPTCFAMDVSGVEDLITGKVEGVNVLSVPMPGAMQLEPSEAGIFSEARSLLAWHDRYKFCPTCGSTTHLDEAGYKRTCDNVDCRSRKGVHNTCYPRVDPSMIMLVVSPDGQSCLLGRGSRHPPKMYSCLAGYMEPGESLEDTCRREVEEESGVKVGRVDYHSSQPWPFPAVLMLGCIAQAVTSEVKVDKDELEDARWFSRAEVVQLLTNQHPQGLFVPPEQAIAHQLIGSWIHMTANL
ncbi:NAD-capped RNA hydrolase NUDT12-like isoform X2 [Liolophura sinensis]|uniref:NAD-capped RNA hydrolase NUDT12-like isoform X2 n=1 Tax=Liolophura sinensis TaxID=3198878 RepID=UPI0031587D40